MTKHLHFMCMLLLLTAVSLFSKNPDKLTYSINNDLITFTFLENIHFTAAKIDSVRVAGTFTRGQDDSKWELVKNGDIWTLTKNVAEVAIPGNSGNPEYNFIVNKIIRTGPNEKYKKGYKFRNNFVILFEGDNPKDIIAKEKKSLEYITDYKNEYQLTNFRNVKSGKIGEGKLFRSYHPFIASKKDHPREEERLAMIKKLMERHNIASIINLSDPIKTTSLKSTPELYRHLAESGNVLCSSTSYETVLYSPDSEDFAQTIREIFMFIAEKKGPYLVHCRIGTDRTGMVTAVLEAFMGAKWSEIAADYLLSNETGIAEYRDEKLLQYALGKMLGSQISEGTELKPLIDKVLTEKIGLSTELLAKVYEALQ